LTQPLYSLLQSSPDPPYLHSFPTRRSSDLFQKMAKGAIFVDHTTASAKVARELSSEAKKRGFDFLDAPVSGGQAGAESGKLTVRSEEHTSELQSRSDLVCRLLLEKKKKKKK